MISALLPAFQAMALPFVQHHHRRPGAAKSRKIDIKVIPWNLP